MATTLTTSVFDNLVHEIETAEIKLKLFNSSVSGKEQGCEAKVLEEVHRSISHPVEVGVDWRGLGELWVQVVVRVFLVETDYLVQVLQEVHRHLWQVDIVQGEVRDNLDG